MAVRIRVYPQYGALGTNALNGGGVVSAATYYNNKLQTQKQVSNLQLGYERALWNERLEKVRLEERLKNPYAVAQMNPYAMMGLGATAYNPYAASMIGSSLLGGANFFGSLGLGRFF